MKRDGGCEKGWGEVTNILPSEPELLVAGIDGAYGVGDKPQMFFFFLFFPHCSLSCSIS